MANPRHVCLRLARDICVLYAVRCAVYALILPYALPGNTARTALSIGATVLSAAKMPRWAATVSAATCPARPRPISTHRALPKLYGKRPVHLRSSLFLVNRVKDNSHDNVWHILFGALSLFHTLVLRCWPAGGESAHPPGRRMRRTELQQTRSPTSAMRHQAFGSHAYS